MDHQIPLSTEDILKTLEGPLPTEEHLDDAFMILFSQRILMIVFLEKYFHERPSVKDLWNVLCLKDLKVFCCVRRLEDFLPKKSF